jgi:hypothetical protein
MPPAGVRSSDKTVGQASARLGRRSRRPSGHQSGSKLPRTRHSEAESGQRATQSNGSQAVQVHIERSGVLTQSSHGPTASASPSRRGMGRSHRCRARRNRDTPHPQPDQQQRQLQLLAASRYRDGNRRRSRDRASLCRGMDGRSSRRRSDRRGQSRVRATRRHRLGPLGLPNACPSSARRARLRRVVQIDLGWSQARCARTAPGACARHRAHAASVPAQSTIDQRAATVTPARSSLSRTISSWKGFSASSVSSFSMSRISTRMTSPSRTLRSTC